MADDIAEMFDLAVAMNGGQTRGALALMQTGAFQAHWSKVRIRRMWAAWDAYYDELIAAQGHGGV